MLAKHTQGPWHTGGNGDRIIYAADGFAVADATVFHGRHEGEHGANARLIAAAPEMFETLQRIATADPSTWDEEVRDQFRQWAQSRARAAIAKVSGA